MKCDVAIIGGGPAGSTCGTLLRKYNPALDVVIVERETFPRDHVGESQLPTISGILSEMGVWDKVEAAQFPIKIGGTYRWGATDDLWNLNFMRGEDFIDEPRPAKYVGQRTATAFQVDRSIYDKILLDHAESVGCRVFQKTRVTKVNHEGDRITGLEVPELEDGRLEARYYVDCSGDVGLVRRALDIPTDAPTALRNIAIWDYWQDADWAVTIGNGGTRIYVLSLGWGWIWFIPITETRTSIGLVLPASYYKESGKSKEQLYQDALQEEPLVRELIKNAKAEGRLEATKDWNFLADRLTGENWFLTGDSGGFADPILSAGMTLAQSGAQKTAYTILELDRGEQDPEWLRQAYSENQRAQIRQHMQFADFWYSANGKFTDLKEYCSEIAAKAGLSLDADGAFRWLGTGGFAVEVPGLARALSYRVAGLKHVTERISGQRSSWETMKSNFWRLDVKEATLDRFPYYSEGRVEAIEAYRRGGKMLPLTGVYGIVVNALRRNMDANMVMDECVSTLHQRDGYELREAVALTGETIEALLAEGWIKGKVVSSRPMVDLRMN